MAEEFSYVYGPEHLCFAKLCAWVEIVWARSSRRQNRGLSDAVIDQIEEVDGRYVGATSAFASGSDAVIDPIGGPALVSALTTGSCRCKLLSDQRSQ